MDMNTGNWRSTPSTNSDFAASLSDTQHVMHKTMTVSSVYDTALQYKFVRIYVGNDAAFHDRVLAATTIQKAPERREAG